MSVQSDMDTLAAAGGGTLELAAGTYTLSTPLLWSGKNVNLRGAGMNNTVIKFTGPGYAVWFGNPRMDRTSPDGSVYEDWQGLSVSDLTVDGTSNTTTLGGLHVWGASRFMIERVRVTGFRQSLTAGDGIVLHGSRFGSVLDCQTADCRYGVKATWPGPAGAQAYNGVRLAGGEHGPGCRVGVMIGEEGQTARTDPVIGSGFFLHGVVLDGAKLWGVWAADGNGLVVRDCYFESNSEASGTSHTGHVRLGNAYSWVDGAEIRGNRFLGGLGQTDGLGACVLAGNARNLWVENNGFNPDATPACPSPKGVKLGKVQDYRAPVEPWNAFAAGLAAAKVLGPSGVPL